MTLSEAFKHIQYFAETYYKGNIVETVEVLEVSYEHVTDDTREALLLYKDWQQRMNSWIEYIK
jgi:hypothetical protein